LRRADRAWARGRLRHGHEKRARDERDRDDHDVNQEDRAPPEVLEQPATDDRAECETDSGESRPDRDRLTALFRREDVGQDRQRCRHHQRGADAHRRSRRDQLAGGVGKRREPRRGADDHQADVEGPAAPIAVTEGTSCDNPAKTSEYASTIHSSELALE
jgi:hypothetical protein